MASEDYNPSMLLTLSSESLYRYQVVSAVHGRVISGEKLAHAVHAIVKQPPWPLVDSYARRISVRSVYRWLRAHEEKGIGGLQRPLRRMRGVSRAIPESLVAFFRTENRLDRYASVPELLRRARELGVIGAEVPIDRVSAWRACRRMELPLMRAPKQQETDIRRFAYPHRMMMVLANGKHFRAGISRTRRVALFFIDDATRLGMHVVVGAAESAPLFLRGLYEVLSRYGFLDVLYLDYGLDFTADDTAVAKRGVSGCQRLELLCSLRAQYQGRARAAPLGRISQGELLQAPSRAEGEIARSRWDETAGTPPSVVAITP